MNIRLIVSVIFFLFVQAFSVSLAQETLILDDFFGIPQAKQVQLRWVIRSGQTCNGTLIERSTDTVHWMSIGDIPGVCGSSSTPVPYNFIDEFPVQNAVNFYRLELGGQGYSNVVGVPYYDFVEDGYVLIPNPAHEKATLYFSTSLTEAFTVSLFDLSGKRVIQKTGSGTNYALNLESLPSGTYLFVISRKGKQTVSGKLIKTSKP